MQIAPADRYPLKLLGLYLLVFAALAINPLYPSDWLLESVVPVVSVAALVATYRFLRFSNLAYSAFFVMLVAHTIGSHYTYAEVPAGFWAAEWFGWERNHYDRLVHFLYGLLLAPMGFELVAARSSPRGIWAFLLPTLFLASHSMLYEIIEWWGAEIFGGDLGQAYLGTQGDVWDAHKDMALGTLGAAVGVAAILLQGRASRKPG